MTLMILHFVEGEDWANHPDEMKNYEKLLGFLGKLFCFVVVILGVSIFVVVISDQTLQKHTILYTCLSNKTREGAEGQVLLFYWFWDYSSTFLDFVGSAVKTRFLRKQHVGC